MSAQQMTFRVKEGVQCAELPRGRHRAEVSYQASYNSTVRMVTHASEDFSIRTPQ